MTVETSAGRTVGREPELTEIDGALAAASSEDSGVGALTKREREPA